jgi:hypothetical protein
VGVEAIVEQDHEQLRTPADIAQHLMQLGIVRPTNSVYAGQCYDAVAVRRIIRQIRRRRGFDKDAYQYIHKRFCEGVAYHHIANELNARGVPHYLGPWTKTRVQGAVERMRKDSLYGLEPLLCLRGLAPQVVALHDAGLTAEEILDRLRQRNALTRCRKPITSITVERILKGFGRWPKAERVSPAATERNVVLRTLWCDTPDVSLVTRRVNELEIRTRRGNPWTETAMNRKLASLGLRDPKKRGPYKKRLTLRERAPQTEQAHRKEFDPAVRRDDVNQGASDVGPTAAASDHR